MIIWTTTCIMTPLIRMLMLHLKASLGHMSPWPKTSTNIAMYYNSTCNVITNLFHYKAILLLSCPYTGIKLPVQVTTSVSCTPNPSNKYYQCHYRPTHYQENNEVSFNCNTWIIQWYLLWPSRIKIIMMQTSLWCSALQPLKCPIIHTGLGQV